MSSDQQFRVACEECHIRKVKCEPSRAEGDSGGGCLPCRRNGRRCLFSLKNKTGRPRKIGKHPPRTTSLPVNPQPKFIPISSSTWPHSIDSTPASSPHGSGSENTDGKPVPSAQSRYSFMEGVTIFDTTYDTPNPIHRRNTFSGYNGLVQEPISILSNIQTSQCGLLPGDYAWPNQLLSPGGSPGGYSYQDSTSPILPTTMDSDMLLGNDSFLDWRETIFPSVPTSHRASISTRSSFDGHTRSNSGQIMDLPQIVTTRPDEELPWSPADLLPQGSDITPTQNNTIFPDFSGALALQDELTRECGSITRRILSLVSGQDSEDVRALLETLDTICRKVAIFIPNPSNENNGQNCPLMDQPTCIVVFAATMQAIDQIIEILSNIVELDQGSTFHTSYDQNMAMSTSNYTLHTNTPHQNTYSLQGNLFLNTIPSHTGNSSASNHTKTPALNLEQLVSLTKLDFYLLRFKNIIKHFQSFSDMLSGTTGLLESNESARRLIGFHRCINRILDDWRSEWGN